VSFFLYLYFSSQKEKPVEIIEDIPVVITVQKYSTLDYFDLYRLLKLTVGNFCFNSICG
jgi:hypothetical protein